MKNLVIFILAFPLLFSCEKLVEEQDTTAPKIREIVFNGIDYINDNIKIAYGDKLQFSTQMEDENKIAELQVSVHLKTSANDSSGIGTTALEFNQTYNIESYQTAEQTVLVSSEIPTNTEQGTYIIDLTAKDEFGNSANAMATFTVYDSIPE